MLGMGRKTDVNYIIFKFFRLNLVYNFSENLMLYGIIYLLYRENISKSQSWEENYRHLK